MMMNGDRNMYRTSGRVRQGAVCFLLLACFLLCPGWSSAPAATKEHQPSVAALAELLAGRPDLNRAMAEAIQTAQRPGIENIQDYYAFLDSYLKTVPTAENWLPLRMELYYIIACAPNDLLNQDAEFQDWIHGFVNSLGRFLDTPESAQRLDTFIADPRYRVDDYIVSPSGWLTFNQFFARHIKPGMRPVASPCDDSVVVSPADSVFIGQWPIDDQSNVTVKGLTWSVSTLLEGSPYRERFVGGVLTQSYLSPYDYHRFHVPVAGTVLEARTIEGRVFLDVYKKEDGSLAVRDELGYQFTQERGLLIIESPVGLVAVIPVGMGIVSSVNLTAVEGTTVAKGEEFGFFAFGGSDILILFEAGMDVNLIVEPGTHYKQGEKIAEISN